MIRLRHLLLAFAPIVFTGCANINAPKYSFAPENVQALKDAGNAKVRLGDFRPANAQVETTGIGMRGAGFSSPYGSFTNYLRQALQQELAEAGRLASDAKVEVSGLLEKHNFNANGIAVGDGELAARITVRREDIAVFDKPVTAKITWESSFAGAVAIPKAVTEYPRLVKEFVGTLLRDIDFINAIK